MVSRFWAFALLVFAAPGCKSANRDLFPISENSHWDYLVRTVNSTKDEVRYSGRVSVGAFPGFEFRSDLGVFRLAWNGPNLVTDQMAGSRMIPPLPILTSVSSKSTAWAGWIDSGERHEPAKATISTEKVRLPIHGISVDTIRTVVELTLPTRTINLVSWYRSGVGLVRQEQRTNGRLDLILDSLEPS